MLFECVMCLGAQCIQIVDCLRIWLQLHSNILALLGLSDSMLISLISWKVAINWWLHQYFESVVSMYEDRFELYVLCKKECEKPADNQAETGNWWRLAFGKPSVPTLLNYVNISPFSLPARRTKELRALAGWYAQSLIQSMLFISWKDCWNILHATWISR